MTGAIDDDPDPEPESDRSRSLVDAIRHLVDTAVDLERRGGIEQRESGRIGGRFPIDYDLSVRLGLDPSSAKGSSRQSAIDSDHLIEVRPDDDGLHITADLPTVDPEDLTVGIDHRSQRLVIMRSGRVIDRVPLGWDDVQVMDARFNNGILAIHIKPNEGDDA